MTEQNLVLPDAGSTYRHATDLSFDDARNGLRYVLLRLSLLGLTEQEQKALRELARRAFNELDIKDAAEQIKSNSASPLAAAIADIVQKTGQGFGGMASTKMAMLGAVFGSYAALREGRSDNGREGVLGAIAGAVAISTSEFLQNINQNDKWMDFVQRD